MTSVTRPGQALSRRELQVLRLIANGYTSAAIASHLGIEHTTGRTHVRRILAKLGARDRANAVALAFAGGIIGPADIGRTDGAEEAAAAAHGAVQLLLVLWRRTAPPTAPALARPWWGQRLDELAHAIRKDTQP